MAKAQRQQKKQAKRSRKGSTKVARQESKGRRKDVRINKRETASRLRTEKRGAVKSAKISKKQYDKLSKVYGDLSPEEIRDLNAIKPYQETMLEELQENEIPINDETDTIEVASKYAVYNDEIETPFDEDLIEDAYADNEDENISDFEHAEKKFNSQRALVASMGAISGGLSAYLRDIEDKSRSGEELTEQEKKALATKKKAKAQLTRSALDFNLQDILPIALIGVAAFFILRK